MSERVGMALMALAFFVWSFAEFSVGSRPFAWLTLAAGVIAAALARVSPDKEAR